MSVPLLSVEGLAVSFATPAGEVEAIRDVSFELAPGEVLGIVGESGSGKTVTCRALLGLLPRNGRIRAGRIRFEGRDLLDLSPQELATLRGRRIAMIFQTPSTYLDPLMTAGRQTGEGLRFHFRATPRDERLQAIELLRDVRILEPERRVDSHPHELSGGMKQRVMIAGALACRPSVLVADEPTTALDVTVQAGILRLLRQLKDEHRLSLIMVSHDLGVIAETCDRVVVMKEGRVVEQGPTREILLRPRHPYTQKLVASHPAFELERRLAVSQPGAAPESRALDHGLDAGQAEEAILRVEALSVTFGGVEGRLARALSRVPLFRGRGAVEAVREVSFSVRPGETLGIVGESGSGKSTIGRCIVGLLQPTAGRIAFRGVPLDSLSGSQMLVYRRSVQIVFQDPYNSLNPRMTVVQTLSEPLRVHRLCPPSEVQQRVAVLMRAVELSPELARRRPHQLSGGQAQRVAIARALTMGPEVLVADEITSSVDVTIQAQILQLLEKLRRDMGLTILLISHDLGVVQKLCHNVLVMRAGRMVEYGPTKEVLRRPTEAYTQELLAAVPRMPVT